MLFFRFMSVLGLILLCSFSIMAQWEVRLSDKEGQPIDDALIIISNKSGVTNEQGVVYFDQLELGENILQVDHINYESLSQIIEVSESEKLLQFNLISREYDLSEAVISYNIADATTPVTFTDVDREEITVESDGRDMPYILRKTPSVVVTSDGGTGIGYTYMRIRGSDQERINFTINGVPLNDAESQQVFWVNLPDFSGVTENIQVQRGLGMNTAGTSAFGASINMNTLTTQLDPSARVGGSVGSFGALKANVQFHSGLIQDKFYLGGQVSRTHTDGYIDRARVDLASTYLTGGIVLDKHKLQFNILAGDELTYQAWNGVGVNLVDDPVLRRTNITGTEKPGEPYDNEVDDYGQQHYQFIHQWQLSSNWFSNFTAHFTKGAGFFELYQGNEDLADFGIETAVPDNRSDLIERRWLDNDFYGFLYNIEHTPSNNIKLQLGGAWNKYIGDHFGEVIWAQNALRLEPDQEYYRNDAVKEDALVYARMNYNLRGNFKYYADLQLRRVYYTFDGVDENANMLRRSVDHVFFSPRLGVQYSRSPQHRWYAFAGLGYKEPNRNDYVESSPLSDPEPESMINVELGYQNTSRRYNYQVNAYLMDYSNQLIPTGELNDVGAATRVNVPDSYRAGVELSGAYAFNQKLSISGNATLSQNKLRAFTQFIDEYDENFEYIGQRAVDFENTALALSPSIVTQIGLGYQAHELAQLSAHYKYISRQYLDNTQSEDASLDPYGVLELRIASDITIQGSTVHLQLSGYNMLNNLFETFGYSYPYFFPGENSSDFAIRGEGGIYRDIGLYPQAGRHFMLSAYIDIR